MKDYSPRRKQIETQIAELRERFTAIETALEQQSRAYLNDEPIEDDEVLESVGRAGLQEIKQLEVALGRIHNRSYSIYHKCGEAISAKSLNVDPFTHLYRDCALSSKG